MRKAGRIGILLAGVVIILGIALTAEAEERMESRGTLEFQCGEGNVSIRTEDISLLRDKVDGIAENAFDPEYYAATP